VFQHSVICPRHSLVSQHQSTHLHWPVGLAVAKKALSSQTNPTRSLGHVPLPPNLTIPQRDVLLFHGYLPLYPLWLDLLHISFRSTFYHIGVGSGGGYFFVLSKGMYAIGKNPFNGKPDSSLQKKIDMLFNLDIRLMLKRTVQNQ